MSSDREPLPAHALSAAAVDRVAGSEWPADMDREWALGGSTGAGVRVCVLDSGVQPDHSDVGPVERAVAVEPDAEGFATVVDDTTGDAYGHGTACAGLIRALAPDVTVESVRVLGQEKRGSGGAMLAGLSWAVEQGYDVINMSLSSTKRELTAPLQEIADKAYFRRSLIVASAHNMALKSWPWRFSSVISVGSHDGLDSTEVFYNPSPPVEFFARGMDLDMPWLGGTRIRASGNSFATANMSGICALIRAKHPDLAPFEVKGVLLGIAGNVERRAG